MKKYFMILGLISLSGLLSTVNAQTGTQLETTTKTKTSTEACTDAKTCAKTEACTDAKTCAKTEACTDAKTCAKTETSAKTTVKKERPLNRVMVSRINSMKQNTTKIIAKFDLDKDGTLNETEKAAMEKTFADSEEVFFLSRSYNEIKAIDANGDLIISDEETQDAPKKLQNYYKTRRTQMKNHQKTKINHTLKTATPVQTPTK
ncbi:MAG: hypothetical protein WCS73_04145 [Lentisphaeria bacterium]